MNDRELLELAAKAFGFNKDADLSFWNPLDNDGSALRLACRLRIDIQWRHESGYVEAYLSSVIKHPVIRELYVGKVDSAVRRAIVRAAAEIGKAMP